MQKNPKTNNKHQTLLSNNYHLFQGKKPKRPCLFCGKDQSRLVRHLKRQHKQEEAVKSAMNLPRVEQQRAFEQIRKEGIYKMNLILIKENLPLLRERRKGECSNVDLRMCGGCRGFFDKKQIYRHKKNCNFITGTACGSVNFAKSSRSAESMGVKEDFKLVLDSFRDDESGKLCQTDHLIILLGKSLWAKSIKKEKHVVMSEMRLLANLVLKMRLKSLNETLSAKDVLNNDHFETLSDAIRDLSTKENGKIKAGLKVRIGFLLKKLIKIGKGHYIYLGEMEKSVATERFAAVLDLNWDFIFYTAQVMCEQRRNTLRKPQAMPVEQDILKLKEYVITEMQKITDDEFKKWDNHDFVRMRNLIVCRLTMFNARRGGEPARLTLQEWREALDGAWVDPNLVQNIQDPLEKALFDQYKLAYSAGKGSKKLVPILIPNDTVKAIIALTEQRTEVGISDANPFLFANTGSSLDHAIGWQSIKFVTKMMGSELEKPELLIADKFRHRLSTMYALLDLPPSEREAFYRHMGHSEAINKHVYQCPLSISEVVNVGGFLKGVDNPSSQISTSRHGISTSAEVNVSSFQSGEDDPSSQLSTSRGESDSFTEAINDDQLCKEDELPDECAVMNENSEIQKEKKNKTTKRNRRYFKWSNKDAELVKDYFKDHIMDRSQGAKGSLPGKTAILNFLKKYPIFMNEPTTAKEHVSIVKAKVFNERQKARSSVNNITI